jgi:predicted DNA-binding protein (MmcQ/YjbR family)
VNVDWIRDLCLSFPHTTEQIQWGDDLVFKVAGKIHAIAVLRPAKTWLCFKVSPEKFSELTERPGIIPAPYLARAKWVALETQDALSPDELRILLRDSYDMVVAKLSRKGREALARGKPRAQRRSATKATPRKRLRAPRHKRKKPFRSRKGS